METKLTNLQATATQVNDYWNKVWIENTAINRPYLVERLNDGSIKCISQYPRVLGRKAYIIGSGPSLDQFPFDFYKSLKPKDKPAIFCSTSNAPNFLAHDIVPEFTVVVDANDGTVKHWLFSGMENDLKSSVLLAPPIVCPDLFTRWKGDIYLFKPIQPENTFIMNVLPWMFAERSTSSSQHYKYYRELIEMGFTNAGCVANSILSLSTFLSFSPLALCGVDFGFPEGLTRCSRYIRTTPSGSKRKPTYELDRDYSRNTYAGPELITLSDNNVYTNDEQKQYRLNFWILWSRMLSCVFNTSDQGTLANNVPVISHKAFLTEDGTSLINTYPIDQEQLKKHCIILALRLGCPPEILGLKPNTTEATLTQEIMNELDEDNPHPIPANISLPPIPADGVLEPAN